jgi:ASC-1-like (ASCH) protein
MISKHHTLLAKLQKSLVQNHFWSNFFEHKNEYKFTFHLAIFKEPYLQYIMDGKKTVETRFSKNRCAPYESVSDGDVLLLKRSGGDIIGLCIVEKVWFYKVDSKSLEFIRNKFGGAICPVDDTFWEERKKASYATLMRITQVTQINKTKIDKRDRRGWMVFDNFNQRSLF